MSNKELNDEETMERVCALLSEASELFATVTEQDPKRLAEHHQMITTNAGSLLNTIRLKVEALLPLAHMAVKSSGTMSKDYLGTPTGLPVQKRWFPNSQVQDVQDAIKALHQFLTPQK